MSDKRPEWDRARDFIDTYEAEETRPVLVAEAMGPDGEFHPVEINIKERMERVMLILMPCSPTVH